MSSVRNSLYQRLPEIYHLRDAAQAPPQQLQAYLDILDQINANVRDNIEALYHDLFIDTCDDWVIPYIADLLGTSHLSGDARDLRADVARTIYHRRRKGTLGAIESLTYALSGWAAHTVELRDRLVWSQHLNHQRPDVGGQPPIPIYMDRLQHISGAVRGGTLTLRDPATLSLLNGPFDPFAHTADIKPPVAGMIRYNLPNLAIFLWRLQDYTTPVIKPEIDITADIIDLTADASGDDASFALRVDVHPLREPIVLFNTHRYDPDAEPPGLTDPDAVPGPMPRARLSQESVSGNSSAYVALDFYTSAVPDAPGEDRVGLTLHLPDSFGGSPDWILRGANLCAWEAGFRPKLRQREIVIDPQHGRLLFGLGGASPADQAVPLADGLFVSATHAFSGSSKGTTGAQPISRDAAPAGTWKIDFNTAAGGVPAPNGAGLIDALADLDTPGPTRTIEIQDSRTYDLDIDAVSGVDDDGSGRKFLRLSRSLCIRAASGQRPIIRLTRPLAFRPHDITGPDAEALMADLNVDLEGIYLTWDRHSSHFIADTALIEQVALNRLGFINCTLDPGNHRALDDVRQPVRYALRLASDFSLDDSTEQEAFNQIPSLEFRRCICGPIAAGDHYRLLLQDSVIDANQEPVPSPAPLAVHDPDDAENNWGPDLVVDGMSCFGRMRVESATGQGGIWVERLQVHDDQQGCIRFSYFSGDADKLPQHQACVFGTSTPLSFVSEVFGEAGYAQLQLRSDRRLLEQGPGRDAMGAFGYLLNTHKWKNINIRYREFMPVGVRPVLIPVT